MKKIFLILMILISILSVQSVHANTDKLRTSESDYNCDLTTGIGTLKLVFGSEGHHLDTRYYTLNNRGWYKIYNGNRKYKFADTPWVYIDGCTNGCNAPTTVDSTHNPIDWKHETIYTYWPDNVAYQYTANSNFWPYWVQARSGDYNAAVSMGDYQWIGDTAVGFSTAVVTFRPTPNSGIPLLTACYPASCGSANSTELKTTPLTTKSAELCAEGSSSAFTSSIDADGITHYSWTCKQSKGDAAPVCDKARYKPVCIPTATNGCCTEKRPNPNANGDIKLMTELDQCSYAIPYDQSDIAMDDHEIPTQSGSSIVNILQTTTKKCRPPINGKPRISCSSNPLITISSTLTSFTLPSTVTRLPGTCTVTFDALDICTPPDPIDITITPTVCDKNIKDPKDPKFCPCILGDNRPVCKKSPPDTCDPDAISPDPKACPCDPTITDPRDDLFCPREVINNQVCISLRDRFGNPVSAQTVDKEEITVLLPGNRTSTTNTYFSNYNSGSVIDFIGGAWQEVDGKYCQNVCLPNDTCCINPQNPSCTTLPSCTPTSPISPTCPCKIGDPRPLCYECVVTDTEIVIPYDGVKYTTDNCTRLVTATPWSWKEIFIVPTNSCPSVGAPIITVPGGGILVSGFSLPKPVTAELQVLINGKWTTEGTDILYDEPYTYRIAIASNSSCERGVINITEANITPVGGAFSGGITIDKGEITATVTRAGDVTPLTPRGVAIKATITLPGGLTYGLTSSATDWTDAPLILTGERMKGVRIIGNSAGTTITNFNLNKGGVIGEETGPSVVAARNAMIKNAALLTRAVPPNNNQVINGVYYAEGDIRYSAVKYLRFKTLIVKGNLTIDENIGVDTPTDVGIGIIVIRDSSGAKGNVIVQDNVSFIHALIFAEETFRGISQTAGVLNPKTQLVLKGTLFSRNTVGGYAEVGKYYTSGGSATTDANLAFRQDLNNVRNGYGCQAGVTCTLYKDRYKDPFIIDFDNMQSAPPPGFSN